MEDNELENNTKDVEINTPKVDEVVPKETESNKTMDYEPDKIEIKEPIKDDSLAMKKEDICKKFKELYNIDIIPEQVKPVSPEYKQIAGLDMDKEAYTVAFQDENGEQVVKICGEDGVVMGDLDSLAGPSLKKTPEVEQSLKATEDEQDKEKDDEEAMKKDDKQEDIDGKADEEADKQKDQIAKKLGITPSQVFMVRQNGNLMKNYPQLREEKGLFFYSNKDGRHSVARYDENGDIVPSELVGGETEGKSVNRTMSVTKINGDGTITEEEKTYNFVRTKIGNESGVKDAGFITEINGDRMEVYFVRQDSQSGNWEAYQVEGQGRDYNSHEVDEATRNNGTNDRFVTQAQDYSSERDPWKVDNIMNEEFIRESETSEGYVKQIQARYEMDRKPAECVLFYKLIGGHTEEEAVKMVQEDIEEGKYKEVKEKEAKEDDDEKYLGGERTIGPKNGIF